MSDKIYYVKSELAGGWRGSSLLPALLLSLLVSSPGSAVESDCGGDYDNDGRVAVSELVRGVRHLLDGCPTAPAICSADLNCNGSVEVSELVTSVRHALDGCPVVFDGAVVSVAWLRQRLGNEDVQLVDARVNRFDGGHIPGAIPLSPYALATTVDGVAAQIVDTETATEVLGGIGLRESATVVVYGVAPEFDPARVVWALEYFGHADVRYLDGGFSAWVDGGAPVAEGPPLPDFSTIYLVDAVRDEIRVTGDWILERLGEPPYEDVPIQIVDARSPIEFSEGIIPTAVHRQWSINLNDGVLLAIDDLEKLYTDLDKTKTTVVYCLAGWRASVAWLVLQHLGFEDVRVYDGSWFEWGDETRGFPIEVPDTV